MTTATTEDLDLAEILAARNDDTPLWNELLAEYDACELDELGTGWPTLTATVDPGESAPQQPAEPTTPEPFTPDDPWRQSEPATEPVAEPEPESEPSRADDE